jgi:predicted lipoprotein with Yx(FWY)xxD motif
MKIRMFLLGLVALGALSLGSSAFAQSTHSHPATVVTTKQTSLGVILVTGSGQTLYLDGADRPGHSACTGGCLSIWPRLKAGGAPKATGGAKASLLGTIKVAGGSRQVTYHGHPLFSFA